MTVVGEGSVRDSLDRPIDVDANNLRIGRDDDANEDALVFS